MCVCGGGGGGGGDTHLFYGPGGLCDIFGMIFL